MRVEQAAQAEAETRQIGGGNVEVEAVAFFAEAAVGFDDVVAEGQVGQGAREVFVFIGDVGFATERNAVSVLGETAFAAILLRQDAGQVMCR